ncbi:MAG: diguanylate cyclase [Pseudomonadota bacterium]
MTESSIAGASRELNRHLVNLLDSLSALFILTELPVTSLDENALLAGALDALRQNQDLERCSIFLLTRESELVNAAGFSWDDLWQDKVAAARPQHRFRIGEGIMGRAAASGELQHCRSCADDPHFSASMPNSALRGTLISVPLRADSTVLGVLNVFHPESGFFDFWHERLLLLFANTLGQLLANCRLLHQREQMVEQRTEELHRTNSALQHEIEERKTAEARLAEEHAFLQTVMDSVLEPIMVIGTDYGVQLMNRAAAALNMDGGSDRFCYQISHRRDSPCATPEHPCPIAEVTKNRAPVILMHQHYDAAGEPRIVELQASPLWNEDGTLRAIVESSRDVTERVLAEAEMREKQQELAHQAHHDPLTGLPNRMLFAAHLSHALARAHRYRKNLALLFLDLDGFKAINDTLGHARGDILLQTVAERLRRHVREIDMVARLSGDEFTILLEDVHDTNDAGHVARNLLDALALPIHLEQHVTSIGVSIGISCYPQDAQDTETLLRHADTAMYQAKAQGKNRYCYYRQVTSDK